MEKSGKSSDNFVYKFVIFIVFVNFNKIGGFIFVNI